MTRTLLLLALAATFASCEKTDCYTCVRDYYDASGAVTKTEQLEQRCNVTQSEYNALSNKYPQYKPPTGTPGWHHHCDKED